MHYAISFCWDWLAEFYFVWILFHLSHRINRRAAESLRIPITLFPSLALTIFFFPILLCGPFSSLSSGATVPSFVLQQLFYCIYLTSEMFTSKCLTFLKIPKAFVTNRLSLPLVLRLPEKPGVSFPAHPAQS